MKGYIFRITALSFAIAVALIVVPLCERTSETAQRVPATATDTLS